MNNPSYSFVRELGSGAMGTIYEAISEDTGARVALKVLHPHLSDDESICQRFDREARASARLQQENYISIQNYGILDDGRHYIAMEFVAGKNLEQIIEDKGALPVDAVVRIGIQIAAALETAHGQKVVHRDLKPANILIEDSNVDDLRLRVCDFGIAKILDSSENSYQTLAGVVCGTPDYMAPEQARGLPLDGRSDLYSLGIVLYELLTACPPFIGKNALELMNQHIRGTAPDVRKKRPDTPDRFAQLLLKLMEKSPENRPADASAVSRSLKKILELGGAAQDTAQLKAPPVAQPPAPADFAMGDTLEQARPSLEGMEPGMKMSLPAAARAPGPTQEMNVKTEKREIPLFFMVVAVIVATCGIYAAFAIFAP